MPRPIVVALLFAAFVTLSLVSRLPVARAASDGVFAAEVHIDPLLQFLPPEDIYMQVPGGVVAVGGESRPGASFEERDHSLHGGIVVGYCLRASCTRVTHLAVLQVCNNRIGGAEGNNRLVLGVVKLPVGDTPGELLSLRGRNYVENFSLNGPYRQEVREAMVSGGAAVHRVLAQAMGPVAPLQYQGVSVAPRQGPDTIALRLTDAPMGTGPRLTHLEIRHFCEQPTS